MKNILSNSNGSKERYQIYMENEVKNSNQIVLTAQGEETIFYVYHIVVLMLQFSHRFDEVYSPAYV